MNHRLAIAAVAIGLLNLSAMGASAQVAPRNYDYGTVTQVTQIEVKPGQLNAYMQDLASGWRASMEEGKRAGAILSYGIEQPSIRGRAKPTLCWSSCSKIWRRIDRLLADAEKSASM